MKDMIGKTMIIDGRKYTVEDSAMLGENTKASSGAQISLVLRGVRGAWKLAFMDVFSGRAWMVA